MTLVQTKQENWKDLDTAINIRMSHDVVLFISNFHVKLYDSRTSPFLRDLSHGTLKEEALVSNQVSLRSLSSKN